MNYKVVTKDTLPNLLGKRVTIYTDGSCRGNPGPGRCACVFITSNVGDTSENFDDELYVIQGPIENNTTNNRQELSGAILALECDFTQADIYTDSKYVMNGITNWIHGWKAKGWKKADGKPVLNKDLWMKLDSLNSNHNINYHWVPGHSGNVYNDLADKMSQP